MEEHDFGGKICDDPACIEGYNSMVASSQTSETSDNAINVCIDWRRYAQEYPMQKINRNTLTSSTLHLHTDSRFEKLHQSVAVFFKNKTVSIRFQTSD